MQQLKDQVYSIEKRIIQLAGIDLHVKSLVTHEARLWTLKEDSV